MNKQSPLENQKTPEEVVAQEVSAVDHERREILRSIHESIHDQRVRGDQKISLTQARFATLLVSLSEQTDKTTKQNLDMQRKVVNLTWGLLGLTIALFLLTAFLSYDVYSNTKGTNQSNPSPTQQTAPN